MYTMSGILLLFTNIQDAYHTEYCLDFTLKANFVILIAIISTN